MGVVPGIGHFIGGEPSWGLLGLASIAFLALFPLLKKVVGGHPWYLYIETFLFCTLAYDIGCVMRGFDRIPYIDKISHFLSGFLFTTLGFCLFLLQRRSHASRVGSPLFTGVSYGVFFSSFVAVFWEICEFVGHLLFGSDFQHHLDTGVFDTMYDLITCFVGSLLCAASILLYLKKKTRLPSGAVVHEFLQVLTPGSKAGKTPDNPPV
ncbi:hypothetical protein LJB76_01825 [Clostridia bacterium OttesenSCG-928-O13]|nr:hypothetical protein [Clostridia bacterium OttesenSCG-928-O13]